MVQAARSGRQNIAGSSRAGAADSTTAVHLTNAARNSLDELLLDYEDFLRQRKLRAWAGDDSEAQAVRNVALEHKSPDALDLLAYAAWFEHKDPAVAANALMCLILQTDVLLVEQAAAHVQRCISQSGCSEQPAAARIAEREVQRHQSDPSDQSDRTDKQFPDCPVCGKIMALRTARKGKKAGLQFWGCTGYPECKGTMPGKNPA
jgi:four helix bundle suffix protein